MNVFLWNARARNGHVEATLNHPFPAQVLPGSTLHAPQFPRWLAPQLHDAQKETPWFGDDERLAAWAPFLLPEEPAASSLEED